MSLTKFVSVLALAGMFTAAQAAPEWTCVGSTFTPDETATPGTLMQMFEAKLAFAAAAAGTIEARCNVTNPSDANQNPGWGHLEITHNDPDGMGNGSQLIVELMEVNKFTGATAVLATYDSNNFAAVILRDRPVPNAWNFVNFAYYINVKVIRANANLNPWLARVRLHD